MTDLIIGLLIGVACAVALLVMWRVAEKLRRDLLAQENTLVESAPPELPR